VALIDSRGHEIASHGMSHVKIAGLGGEKLEYELIKSRELLEAIIKKKVMGFRAPDDHLNIGNLATYGAIAGAGYIYDCSFMGNGPRIESNRPFNLISEGNRNITVVPQSLRRELWFHIRFGEKARTLPSWFIMSSIEKLNGKGLAAMINMKLWEIDKHHPRPFNSDYLNFGTYGNLQFSLEKLQLLLEKYKFISCSEFLSLSGQEA
jgi:hypothetical protein